MKTKQKMSKVSIIIPVYNAERYLEKCLDSVLHQTITDLEIICVDDGSTDGSSYILKQYELLDNRVKVIHKENGGLVSARKAGVMAATGEYIGYVDSDDWIEPDMYEKLVQYADKYDVNLVTCGYYLEGNYTTIHLDTVEEGLYTEERIQHLRDNAIYRFDRKETGLRGSLCCKLFKKKILQKVQLEIPDKVSIAEDKLCLINYLLHCKTAYVSKTPYYHWCIHQESMGHKNNHDYLLCVHEVYKCLMNFYGHVNFTEQMRNQAELYVIELLVLGINTRLGFRNRNLLRIDPYWLSAIPQGAKVVLYGGGDLGEQYRRQLRCRKDVCLVKYLDFDMPSVEQLQELSFDCLVITIKNRGKAQQVKAQFIQLGVAPEKILWFEQPEVYWKYAEAEGLLDSKEKGNIESDITKGNKCEYKGTTSEKDMLF